MKNKLFWLTSCCYQKSWLVGINLFIHHHSSADSRFDSPRVSRRANGGKVCARISVVRNLIFITSLESPRGWIKREFSDRFLSALCLCAPSSDGRVGTCGRNKNHISQSLFNKFLSDLVKALLHHLVAFVLQINYSVLQIRIKFPCGSFSRPRARLWVENARGKKMLHNKIVLHRYWEFEQNA